MLKQQARHVRIISRQNQLCEPPAHYFNRPRQIFQDIGIVDTDLQHYAAQHIPSAPITPGTPINFAQPVATNVCFRVH